MKHILSILLVVVALGCTNSSSSSKAEKAIEMAKIFQIENQISSMDNGLKSRNHLNGVRISYERNPQKRNTKEVYYIDLLAKNNISVEKYEYLRTQLSESNFNSFYRKSDFSFFSTGGALGDINGVVVVHNDADIPEDGIRINSHYFVWFGKKLSDNVYYFSS